MWPKDWSPRDWRQMLGIILLGMGGVASTGVCVFAIYALWHMPEPVVEALHSRENAKWIGWIGLIGGALGIIIVLTALSTILGRRTYRLKVGEHEAIMAAEDAERVFGQSERAE